jgi:oligopeptide/dipeptide ABC transporter ATP-binding protein
MAISNSPDLLIADEPTTALDVTIQAQVLELLRSIQKELALAMIFISHSLGVVNSIADQVSVMYAGRIVESGPCSDVLSTPSHPYTRALTDCFPEIGRPRGSLVAIDGQPPRHIGRIDGCRFRDRCKVGRDRLDCVSHDPVLKRAAGDRSVACHAVAV